MKYIIFFIGCFCLFNSCETTNKELADLKKQNSSLKVSLTDLEMKMKKTENDNKRLNEENDEIKRKLNTLEYRNERLNKENEEIKEENRQLMKGENSWTNYDFPINKGFNIWSEFGMYIGFGHDDTVTPITAFPEVIKINDNNDFLKDNIFRNNDLYAFILNEFSRFDWDRTYSDYEPPLSYIKNPGRAAQIFDEVIGFHIGYFKENDFIALVHVYREMGHLVGIIIPEEKILTKFSKPLTIDASQNLFGRPTYYIVERPVRDKETVLTVYRLDKSRFLMIFEDGVLMGICLI
jgi:hypothetical protein